MSDKQRALAKSLRERPMSGMKDIFGRGGYTVKNYDPPKKKPKEGKVLNVNERRMLDEET